MRLPFANIMNTPSWKHHLFRSAVFAISIMGILLVLELTHQVVIASVIATSCIVFAMPQVAAARPRNILLGQGVGLLVGMVCSLMPMLPAPLNVLNFALAVGICFLILVMAKINHPPAVVTAFGVTMTGISLELIVILVLYLLLLACIQVYFGRHMKSLL